MRGDLLGLLTDSNLVLGTAPTPSEIERAVDARSHDQSPVVVMYGETYDRYGVTLDSLKYYFAVSAVARASKLRGANATGTILIADVATCRNEPEGRHAEIMAAGRTRAVFVRALSALYRLDLRVLLMSEYLHSEHFQETLKKIRLEANRDVQVHEWVRQTVPEDKVAVEEQKGFAYAFEEIATIIEYDVKIGPPREKFYDEPARLIARRLGLKSLSSIYLRPTYPLGVSPGVFTSNPELELYGVTPYKAGSKGLQKHRIVLGRAPLSRISELVNASFVSKKPDLPNPVLDVALIAEMAGGFLQSPLSLAVPKVVDSFCRGELSPKELKQQTTALVAQYVLEPVSSLTKETSHV